jgi:release factor glutamine methyltransferase
VSGASRRSEPAQRPDTLLAVLRAAERYLVARSIEAPRRSAELLLARALGMSRLQLYLAHDRPIDDRERVRLRELIMARGRGVPVAHLLGDWEFFGLELEITKDVLIPRPETEHLVELAIELAPRGGRCVEIGSGSGAIAIALAAHRPDLTVTAVEVSPAAAAVARRNVARHAATDQVRLVVGRSWQALANSPLFDLLVANPPYVDPAQPDLLAPDVREFEPAAALFTAPGDPASAYRELVADGRAHLRSGAWLLLETGLGAHEAALAELRAAAWLTQQELRTDLAGLPRYLLARAR